MRHALACSILHKLRKIHALITFLAVYKPLRITYVYAGLGESAGTPPDRYILPVIITGVVDVQCRQEVSAVGINGEDSGGVALVVVGVQYAGVYAAGGQPRGLVDIVIGHHPHLYGMAEDWGCERNERCIDRHTEIAGF